MCLCMRMCTCTCASLYVYMFVYVCMCANMFMCMRIHARMYVYLCQYIHLYMCVCMCVRTCMHACMYTYVYVYIHVCIQVHTEISLARANDALDLRHVKCTKMCHIKEIFGNTATVNMHEHLCAPTPHSKSTCKVAQNGIESTSCVIPRVAGQDGNDDEEQIMTYIQPRNRAVCISITQHLPTVRRTLVKWKHVPTTKRREKKPLSHSFLVCVYVCVCLRLCDAWTCENTCLVRFSFVFCKASSRCTSLSSPTSVARCFGGCPLDAPTGGIADVTSPELSITPKSSKSPLFLAL
jgi:hypothetical protein